MIALLLACTRSDIPSEPDPPSPDDTGATPVPTTSSPGPTTTGDTGTVPDPIPDTFEAPFLWAPIQLVGAPDLGHVPEDVASPVAPGPLAFTEVGVAAGLSASHAGGNLHGVGIAFVDLDADGWDDLVIVNGHAPSEAYDTEAWRNRGDGTFEDATAATGIDVLLGGVDGYSVAAGDLDRDGDVDLYVGAHPTDRLLLNAGDGTFTDGTAALGAGGPPSAADGFRAKLVATGDHDADGRLDLVSASDTFVDPGPNGYVLRGTDAGFADVTAATGFAAPAVGTPCALMWTDHDADGFADLAIWSDFGDPSANRALLRSDGLRFTDVTAAVGWTNPVGNPMGIDAADLDRDGWLDYLVGNDGPNVLLVSNADGTWLDLSQVAGIDAEHSWGLAFEDLDADGWWDAFVGQNGTFDHRAYRNLGADPLAFEGTSVPHQVLVGGNVAVAAADYDHDGDVDFAAGGVGGARVELFRNDTDRGTARTLEVRIEAAPEDGAAGGVGARVVVAAGDLVLWRDVTGGSSRGSQNALSARFGLGQRTGADWVAVLWPDGRQLAVTGVPGDATLVFGVDGPTLR